MSFIRDLCRKNKEKEQPTSTNSAEHDVLVPEENGMYLNIYMIGFLGFIKPLLGSQVS